MDQTTAPASSTEPARGDTGGTDEGGGGGGNDCVVFNVGAEFGHFRQPHASPSAETYGIMPRTTAVGLIAGMLGMERDSYYELFAPGNSRIAVSVEAPVRRQTVGINYLDTRGSGAKTIGAKTAKYVGGNRDPTAVVLLSEPSYRIYVSVDDAEIMDEIDAVARGADPDAEGGTAPTYTPTMGKASHLAWIDYVGRFPIETPDSDREQQGAETIEIRSAVPGEEILLVVDPGQHYVSERMTAHMETTDGGRIPAGSHTITYARSGAPVVLRAEAAAYNTIGGDHVVFS